MESLRLLLTIFPDFSFGQGVFKQIKRNSFRQKYIDNFG